LSKLFLPLVRISVVAAVGFTELLLLRFLKVWKGTRENGEIKFSLNPLEIGAFEFSPLKLFFSYLVCKTLRVKSVKTKRIQNRSVFS
jgi:hypothetical protein